MSVGEMSCRRNVQVVGEMSVGEILSAKDLSDKCPISEVSGGEISVSQMSLHRLGGNILK